MTRIIYALAGAMMWFFLLVFTWNTNQSRDLPTINGYQITLNCLNIVAVGGKHIVPVSFWSSDIDNISDCHEHDLKHF